MPLLNLAIETSSRCNSVAILSDNEVLQKTDQQTFQRQSPDGAGLGASALLMPMIQSLFSSSGITPQQLDLISVAEGPGMFTGLRVGIVTAKTMAYALSKPVVAVDTLYACAWQTCRSHQLPVGTKISAVINAQRGQLFAARFQVATDGALERIESSTLVSPDQWIETISNDEWLTGPGLKLAQAPVAKLREDIPSVNLESESDWACDVEAVGAIGKKQFVQSGGDDLWSLKPIYFRPSAAEEVRNQNSKV